MISAKEVQKLRSITNLPMMDCKNALVKANGDFAKAFVILKSELKSIEVISSKEPSTAIYCIAGKIGNQINKRNK